MKLLKFSLFALLLSSTLFIACSDDDSDDDMQQQMTIAEIVSGDDRFTTLLSALERTGLDATLAASGTFTVFAPTDQAFTDLGVDLSTLTDEQLTDILLYHVLGSEVAAGDIPAGNSYVTTSSTAGPDDSPLSLFINNSNGAVLLNDSIGVVQTNIDASNGIVHVINGVLTLPTILDLAGNNPDFSLLVGAVGDADPAVLTALSGNGPLTVFAPVNSAFEAIADVLPTLTEAQLTNILLYHVVAGNNRAEDLVNGSVETQLMDASITVNVDGNVTITDEMGNVVDVIGTNVQGTNGVIHGLDAVLMPN